MKQVVLGANRSRSFLNSVNVKEQLKKLNKDTSELRNLASKHTNIAVPSDRPERQEKNKQKQTQASATNKRADSARDSVNLN